MNSCFTKAVCDSECVECKACHIFSLPGCLWRTNFLCTKNQKDDHENNAALPKMGETNIMGNTCFYCLRNNLRKPTLNSNKTQISFRGHWYDVTVSALLPRSIWKGVREVWHWGNSLISFAGVALQQLQLHFLFVLTLMFNVSRNTNFRL